MKSCHILLTILAFGISLQANPGLGIRLNKKGLNQFIPLILPKVNEFINLIDYEKEIYGDGITLSRVKIHIDPISANQVIVYDDSSEFLSITFNNLSIRTTFLIEIGIGPYFKIGTGECSNKIKKSLSYFWFRDLKPSDARPYLKAKIEGIEIDKDSIDVSINIPLIPKIILDRIIDLFRTVIVEKIVIETAKIAESLMNQTTEQIVKDNYPLSVNLPDSDVVLSSGLIEQPKSAGDNIWIPIDGVFFSKDQGYKRDIEPAILQISQSEKLIEALISEATLNYLLRSVDGFEQFFSFLFAKLYVRLFSNYAQVKINEQGIEIKDLDISFDFNVLIFEEIVQIRFDSAFSIGKIDRVKKELYLNIYYLKITKYTAKGNIPFFEEYRDTIISLLERFIVNLALFPVNLRLLPKEIDIDSLEINCKNQQIEFLTNLSLQSITHSSVE